MNNETFIKETNEYLEKLKEEVIETKVLIKQCKEIHKEIEERLKK